MAGWIAKMTDPVVTVTGDPTGGFIVEVHDGDRHMAFGLTGGDEAAAQAEGLRRFQAEAPVGESPSATVAHVETMVASAASRFEALIREAEARIEAKMHAMLAPKPVPTAVTSGGTTTS